MVSTRSGKVVVSTPLERTTRSRARALEEEDAAADAVGQPEVLSPAPTTTTKLTPAKATPQPSPLQNPVFGFGSPVGPSMEGTPLTERIVKTVGKTPTAQTPSVKQIASMPLPDDGNETEPFASSEDEEPRSLPTSPGMRGAPSPRAPAPAPPGPASEPAPRTGGAGGLFGIFTLSSLVVTLLLALVLAPCGDAELYARMRSASAHYEPLCKGLVRAQTSVADAVWRLRAAAADQAASLHAKLPPNAQQLLARALEPVHQAHAAALPVIADAVTQAQERLAPFADRAKQAWRDASRESLTRLAPLLEAALQRVNGPTPATPATSATPAAAAAPAPPPAPKPVPISCMSLTDFQALLDQSPRVQQYAAELWDAAAVQVATKRKAAVWVLACRSVSECAAASGGLFSAASSFYRVDGAAFDQPHSAGALQAELATYLRSQQNGLVMVGHPDRLHPNSVAVINAAVSEGGHLTQDGVPVVSHRALYVVLAEVETGDVHDEAAVKDSLCSDISDVDPEAGDAAAAIVRSFRRRLDAVLPVRELAAGEEAAMEPFQLLNASGDESE